MSVSFGPPSLPAGYQPVLQDMYANWPFFTSTLDLVEMVLAKVCISHQGVVG